MTQALLLLAFFALISLTAIGQTDPGTPGGVAPAQAEPMQDSDNVILKHALRVLLTPTRSAANLLRFKMPWYRDPHLR